MSIMPYFHLSPITSSSIPFSLFPVLRCRFLRNFSTIYEAYRRDDSSDEENDPAISEIHMENIR